jgi:dTDP-4-amino-4,6-dideoxygalactose transaminase
MFPIILDEKINAANVIHYLNACDIEVRKMMPIIDQPVVQEYFSGRDLTKEFPRADFINRQGFYVGSHPELSLDDVREMGNIISEAIRRENV